ncbi:trypsin-like peptidase domain-containing protein (plasmid) [Rhizobium leguminosarum]
MTHWIDTSGTYPWSEPLARDLHKRLVNTFYEPAEIRKLVQSAEAPDWMKVNWNVNPSQIWSEVLDLAHREGSLRDLLQFIVTEERVAKPLTAFINDLLAKRQPPADPGPGGRDGSDFASDVSREEALLFGDDLSESVGDIPELMASITRVMAWRSAVCRLLVTADDGRLWNGTGLLLTGNRVLTNHHVLFPGKTKCSAVSIEFNYENDAAGQKIASHVVPGDVGTIRSDPADDWGVISTSEPLEFAPLDLASNIATPVAAERAFILQHPDGDPKRLAFTRNRIASLTERRVYYLTDTRGGSSGSPVFDAQGKLIALHRAGGEPQKLAGVDPIKKNEGVRMDVIAQAIASADEPSDEGGVE